MAVLNLLYSASVLNSLCRAALILFAVGATGCSDPATEETPCPPPPAAEDATGELFVDATAELGVAVTHHLQSEFCDLPDTVGGTGVCLFDFDQDGDLDMYFVDRAPEPNTLLRNDGGQFTDVSAESGADITTDSMGCLAFDYDADGDLDLYVTNVGADVLLENDDGAFTDATARAGIDAPGFGVSATAGDVDADGDLDLFVGQLVDNASCPDVPDACLFPPLACSVNQRNLLFINDGGTFTEDAVARGITEEAPTLATLMFDFDLDGDVDIYVGNDMGTVFDDHLYLNDGEGTFSEAAADYDVDAPGTCTMGVDAGDFDRDGRTDMVITDFEDRPVRLFRCFEEGRPCSNEVAPDGKDAVKWGVGFVDLDNDFDLDLFVANGEVRFWEPERNFLYFNDGTGVFNEHVAGSGALTELFTSRSAAFGDLDDDGDVDIVVTNAGDRVQVLLNQAAAGHALHVALDSQAAGARVNVSPHGSDATLAEPVVIGGSFASTNDARVHFGLGEACRADIEVTYVDGETKTITDAESGAVIVVER